MSVRSRLVSALLSAAILALLVWICVRGAGSSSGTLESLFSTRDTLHFWYTDDAMTEFYNEAAVDYGEYQNDVRVEPTLVEDTDYIKLISDRSIEGENFPDLFCTANNTLERVYKGGLAAVISDDHITEGGYYPQAAIDAVTYDGNIVAYPVSFETSVLLYNKDLLADALEGTDSDGVPKTFVDIINFADGYDAPEGVTAILKWDVSDIFYNYCFVGNYMDVGGPAGDDPDRIDIYNSQVIQCMSVYQQLNQFFSIDTRTDDYDSVIDDFAKGKIVYTIATTDAAAKIREMKENGETDINYGVTLIPDSTDTLKTKTMSITNCIAVNAYGEHQDEANDFIQYLLYKKTGDFYDRTGKALAQAGYAYSDQNMNGYYEAYVSSVPMTKLREAANFWMLLESAFANVWDGADANDTMHDLAQQVMVQITGTNNYTVEKIPDPEEVSISSQLEEVD